MGFLTPKGMWGAKVKEAHKRGQTLEAKETKRKAEARARSREVRKAALKGTKKKW